VLDVGSGSPIARRTPSFSSEHECSRTMVALRRRSSFDLRRPRGFGEITPKPNPAVLASTRGERRRWRAV
jgi:hypothetical protein